MNRLHRVTRLLVPALPALLLGALVVTPAATTTTRAAIVVCAGLLWAECLRRAWRSRLARALALAPALPLLLVASLPARAADPAALRAAYVERLRAYAGVPYVWGGENARGIDCSGLLRRALIDARLRRGLATADAGLLRAAADLWWHDTPARTFIRADYAPMRQLGDTPRLGDFDHARLLPGDLAVTADGVHCLAYLGEETWIHADPIGLRVVTFSARDPRALWAGTAARFTRWRDLDSAPGG